MINAKVQPGADSRVSFADLSVGAGLFAPPTIWIRIEPDTFLWICNGEIGARLASSIKDTGKYAQLPPGTIIELTYK